MAFSPRLSRRPDEVQQAKQQQQPSVLKSMLRDIRDLKWMVDPVASLRLIILIVAIWGSFQLFFTDEPSKIINNEQNPLSPLLFISYPLPLQPEEDNGVIRYAKGLKDLLFLAFYVLVFSFIRQAALYYIIKPIAIRVGIRGERKLERFMEQGYAFMYWSTSSAVGLYVMSGQPTWWYETKAFWIDYPHWRMRPDMKAYYLLQFAYWLQQLLVLALRLEKPRTDFVELCLHHIVTLWLIGWSYSLNLTYIGVAIFFSMDIADVFLALSKMLNYMNLQRTSEVSFAALLVVWSYFRHWQNLRILYSVWYEYDTYVPEHAKVFDPLNGVALAGWIKYQVFIPIAALQLLNLFWYFLMWRIVWRMLNGSNATDVREEAEDEGEGEVVAEAKKEK